MVEFGGVNHVGILRLANESANRVVVEGSTRNKPECQRRVGRLNHGEPVVDDEPGGREHADESGRQLGQCFFGGEANAVATTCHVHDGERDAHGDDGNHGGHLNEYRCRNH